MDQQSELALILGPDPASLETLVSHLMSSSNEQRSRAETLFNLGKQSNPDELCLRLADILQVCTKPEIRAMASILLRQLLTHDYSYIWPHLNVSTKSSIKSVLLSQIQFEATKNLIKKLCDTVAGLASSILRQNGWPELLSFMCVSLSSGSPKLKESVFLLSAQLSQYIGGDVLTLPIKDLHKTLLFESSDADVQFAALIAVINLCLTSSTERDRYQNLLPSMMDRLAAAFNYGYEATAQEALVLLIELARTEPRFFRRQLLLVLDFMLCSSKMEPLEEGTRHLAIEFVVTLAEARERAPGMMRNLPAFIHWLFGILMKMLLDIEDEDAGETTNYTVGQESLARLAISLGGNSIFLVASKELPAYFDASEWKKRHAALICLAQIAKGCAKVMIKNLEPMVSMVINSFCDSHPRVRWAAISAIGQLSTDLGPDLQNQYHQRVLLFLACAIGDRQNPRVQAHAASAVLNFNMKYIMQNGKQMVQEGALTGLALVADSSQEHFQKYYDKVMPNLKALLVNANDKSNRMLRAKSMECISLVGMAVGKEKFGDDAMLVMEVLMSLQGSQMETDDPTRSYMLQAWARLCKCLGEDFLPYMSVVMPPLLHSAQLKPDVDDGSVETITLGDKRIGIKTSVLEEKATACKVLCCYADELKEGFFPWIDQVAPTLVPLVKFNFDEEVRKAAVSAMPKLLRSAKLAVEKGMAQGHNETYVKQLFDYIIPALVEALHKEPDTEICASMLHAMNECIQISGTLLDFSLVRSIMDEIKQTIMASARRRRETAERAKAVDLYAEEGQLIEEENEQEKEVIYQVGEILGTLLKTLKALFFPYFNELSSDLTTFVGFRSI